MNLVQSVCVAMAHLSMRAPLPREVEKPSTSQMATLLLAERELEAQRAVIRRVKDRGNLPPLGLRTYPNRQGVTVQAEEDGACLRILVNEQCKRGILTFVIVLFSFRVMFP